MTHTEIYQYACGWRPYLRKQVGMQDSEDLFHEWFIALLKAEKVGRIEGPFPNYALVTLRHLMYRRWAENSFARDNIVLFNEATKTGGKQSNPEQRLLSKERAHVASRTLHGLKPRQREVLTRFYLDDESRESIQKAMNLTDIQFSNLKSRAKAAYGTKGKAQMVICNQ